MNTSTIKYFISMKNETQRSSLDITMRPRGTDKYPWLTNPSIAHLTKSRYTYCCSDRGRMNFFRRNPKPNLAFARSLSPQKTTLRTLSSFYSYINLTRSFPSKYRQFQTTGTAHKGHWLALSPNRPSGGRSPVLMKKKILFWALYL